MKTNAKIADMFIKGLKKAQVELEEFQLQLALGKAEAKDHYEEAKKKFRRLVQGARLKAQEIKGKRSEVQAYLDELQVQLALGKAETLDAFNEQKKRITRALSKLEIILQENNFPDEIKEKLQHEIEKFKIKLDILRIYFEFGKLEVKSEFDEKKEDFLKKLQKIKDKIAASGKVKAKHFNSEMKLAYRHLKKAFV